VLQLLPQLLLLCIMLLKLCLCGMEVPHIPLQHPPVLVLPLCQLLMPLQLPLMLLTQMLYPLLLLFKPLEIDMFTSSSGSSSAGGSTLPYAQGHKCGCCGICLCLCVPLCCCCGAHGGRDPLQLLPYEIQPGFKSCLPFCCC
jgi:hypothetical protein